VNYFKKLSEIINLQKQKFIIKFSGLFNQEYYHQNYSEIHNSSIDPVTHYLKTGWHEGKNPSSDFITDYYLFQNPDVRESGMNPLVHYIRFGKEEGRSIHPAPNSNFLSYQKWIQKYDILEKSDITNIQSHIDRFEKFPKITIIMLINDHPEELITMSIQSVINQIYSNWDLNIILKENKKEEFDLINGICHNNPKCKISFFKIEKEVPYISNTALQGSSGEFFIQIAPSEILREHALYLVANDINEHPEADVFYTDEDKINQQNERSFPFFKPDWNPDLFLSKNFLSHLGCFRKNTALQVGGFKNHTGADSKWDLAMRIIEKIPSDQIRHIPQICVHVHEERDQEKANSKMITSNGSQFQTLLAHFARLNKQVEVIKTSSPYFQLNYLIPSHEPLVSILIPTKDHPQLLEQCIDSITNKSTYSNYEILVINNQTTDPQALKLYNVIKREKNITIITYNHLFNYSALNNFAVQQSNGSVLVFLNDDIQVISPGWLEEMVNHASRSEIGAVGAMLYFPNELIQHAGIVLNYESIAEHAFYLFPRGFNGQNDRARLVQNYSSVTGACMAVEKSKFMEVGGFNEKQLAIAYNDVDLCLRLLQAGYRNLWTPYAELYHCESASRGYESTRKKQKRIQSEAKYMRESWGAILKHDPAYNPNLDKRSRFSLAFPPRLSKPWE